MAATCSICLEKPGSPVVTPCGHVYCDKCLTDYVKSNADVHSAACPECQTKFPTVMPDLRYLPEKYHPFVTPSIRRVYANDEGEGMADLRKRIADLEESVAKSKTENARLLNASAIQAANITRHLREIDDMKTENTKLKREANQHMGHLRESNTRMLAERTLAQAKQKEIQDALTDARTNLTNLHSQTDRVLKNMAQATGNNHEAPKQPPAKAAVERPMQAAFDLAMRKAPAQGQPKPFSTPNHNFLDHGVRPLHQTAPATAVKVEPRAPIVRWGEATNMAANLQQSAPAAAVKVEPRPAVVQWPEIINKAANLQPRLPAVAVKIELRPPPARWMEMNRMAAPVAGPSRTAAQPPPKRRLHEEDPEAAAKKRKIVRFDAPA